MISAKRIYTLGGITMSALVLVSMFFIEVNAQSYQETKSTIMQDIYSNQDYLPLIDIQQATIDLNSLKASLDRIQDQASLREEQEETINSRVGQLRIAIATILKDTASTEKDIRRMLQSLAILKKKITTNETVLKKTQDDLEKHQRTITQYLRFLYITQNSYGSLEDDTSIIRLLIQEQSLAESLSEENFIKLLTKNISVLIETLTTKQALIQDLIQTMRSDTQLYTTQSLSLKEHLEYLKQQKSSVYELMSYLQQESSNVTSQLERIESSKVSLVDTQQRLEKIVQIAPTAGIGSELFEKLNQDDRSLDNNFYSRPFVGKPVVLDRYSQKSGLIRFELPQSTALYSPAAGIVHQVQRDESAELGWIVILHKNGYATFFASLSEVFVEKGQTIERGKLVGKSGGKPGTRGAGIDSTGPHLDFTVMKSGKSVDPLTMLDLSVFDESVIVGKYQKDYIQDQGMRQVYVTAIDRMQGLTLEDRAKEFLSLYARGAFADPTLWYEGSKNTGINPIMGMCIGFAETSFKNFKTPNNIGNVGNDDRGRTVTFESPLAGVLALFNVFNNQYLKNYNQLDQLSRFGNEDGFIYASSPYNRQKNIMNCLTSIYGYRVPEDFTFRVPVEK